MHKVSQPLTLESCEETLGFVTLGIMLREEPLGSTIFLRSTPLSEASARGNAVASPFGLPLAPPTELCLVEKSAKV